MPWYGWVLVAWAAPWPPFWLLGRFRLPWWPRDGSVGPASPPTAAAEVCPAPQPSK